MPKLIFAFSFCFLCAHIHGSDSTNIRSKQSIYFSVGLSALVFKPIKISNIGVSHLESILLPSGEFKIGVGKSINKNWSIEGNIYFGLVPFGYKYDFKAPEQSVFFDSNFNRLDNYNLDYDHVPHFALEASVLRKLLIKDENCIEVGLGVRLNSLFAESGFTSGHTFSIENESVRLFRIQNNQGTNNLYTFSILFQSNYVKKLKRNYLSLGLVANLALRPFDEGSYYFSNLGYLSYGSYTQSMSFFGFQASYRIVGDKSN